MAVENVKCPNCGATLVYEGKNRRYVCEYCHSTYRDKKENRDSKWPHIFNVPRPEIKSEDLERIGDIIGDVGKGIVNVFDHFTKRVIPMIIIGALCVILGIITLLVIVLLV